MYVYIHIYIHTYIYTTPLHRNLNVISGCSSLSVISRGVTEIKCRFSFLLRTLCTLSRKGSIFRRFRKQDVFLKRKRKRTPTVGCTRPLSDLSHFAFTASAIREAAHFHRGKIITIRSFYARAIR